MLDINLVKVISDLKKTVRPYVLHNDLVAKPKTIFNNNLQEKRITEVIEKQIFAPLKKLNSEYKFYVDIAIDNKANFLCNYSWGMQVSIWYDGDGGEELEVVLAYLPIENIVYYWTKDGGIFVQRNERTEKLSISNNPSAVLCIDMFCLLDAKQYLKIVNSPYRLRYSHMVSSGSIIKDKVDFLLGRASVLVIHKSTMEKLNDNFIKVLLDLDVEVIKYDGTLVVVNKSSADCIEMLEGDNAEYENIRYDKL